MGWEVIDIPYTKGISSTKLNDELKSWYNPNIGLAKKWINAKPLVKILESPLD